MSSASAIELMTTIVDASANSGEQLKTSVEAMAAGIAAAATLLGSPLVFFQVRQSRAETRKAGLEADILQREAQSSKDTIAAGSRQAAQHLPALAEEPSPTAEKPAVPIEVRPTSTEPSEGRRIHRPVS